MIAFLTGRVAGKAAGFSLIDVGGIGYKLLMSACSLAALPAVGDEVTVQTYLHVREDELTLFGFENDAEKSAFEHLISVSKVGPKVALATLSVLTPAQLAEAVATEDVALVSSVPGVGKKTAQRIIVDLADRLGTPPSTGAAARAAGAGQAVAEATDALLAMGFSAAEASSALKGETTDDAATLVRHALKKLGGGS